MTRVDKKRLDKIEREEWRLCHPGWWQDKALNILLAIVSIIIGILIFYWCSVARVTEVEAAVFHKETEKILYVERLDTTKAQTAEFPPEAIEVNNSSPSDAEAEIEGSDMATDSDAEEERWESLGKYKLSFYCACRKCSGNWGHRTSSGATCQEGVTVACAILPAGTRVKIEGYGERIVQDTGAGVRGKHLDVFMESHSQCLKHGIQYREVWIKK